MFLVDKPSGALEQGDVCLSLPLPIITDTMDAYVGKKVVGIDSLTAADLGRGLRSFVVTPLVSPVIVLSQSCDLLDAETIETARVLVAPITEEGESALLTKSREKFVEGNDRDLIAKALQQRGENPPKEIAALNDQADKQRIDTLRRVWEGVAVGVFPLREIADGPAVLLKRSIVHFDQAVSLPRALWLDLLKAKRIARLDPTWRSILQESLGEWLGRFAYPGTLADRTRVGLGDELPQKMTPRSAQPGPPQGTVPKSDTPQDSEG